MPTEPRDRVPAGPVHACRTPQRIALVQSLGHPWQLRYRHARPDRVACPEQRTEVHSVLRPQRRNYQVIPAGMRTSPALALDLPTGSDPRPAHHARRAGSDLIDTVLSGAPRPSPGSLSTAVYRGYRAGACSPPRSSGTGVVTAHRGSSPPANGSVRTEASALYGRPHERPAILCHVGGRSNRPRDPHACHPVLRDTGRAPVDGERTDSAPSLATSSVPRPHGHDSDQAPADSRRAHG